MRVALVTGSRNWPDPVFVWNVLNQKGPDLVIHGACPTGADDHTKEWCFKTQTPQILMPAQWDKYGKSAGPNRNMGMCDMAKSMMLCGHEVIVLAFPMEDSKGTIHCMDYARKIGLEVKVYE